MSMTPLCLPGTRLPESGSVRNLGFVIGADIQPLTVNTYRGTPMVFTIVVNTDWIVPPALYFPDQDLTWTSEIVVDHTQAARWDITADDVEDVPDSAPAELRWDGRVLARGIVRRKGS